jgi:hypothetical protein
MEKKKVVLFLLVGAIFLVNLSFGEEITLTTFYPSPSGVYKDLKSENMKVDKLELQPQSQLPSNPSEGMIFFSDGEVKNSKDEILPRGLWIYSGKKWFPMAIFRPID